MSNSVQVRTKAYHHISEFNITSLNLLFNFFYNSLRYILPFLFNTSLNLFYLSFSTFLFTSLTSSLNFGTD